MQRLFSPKLEATALRSITSSDERISGWMFPRLGRESFSYEPSLEFFRRIQFLTNKNGVIPRWEDLLEDLTISEDARDELDKQPSGIIESRREAKLVLGKLDEYRRARVFFGLQKAISHELRSDKVDLEVLEEKAGEYLSRARSGASNIEDAMSHFGGRRLDKRILAEMLRREDRNVIPTGFRAFDSQNDGVPFGSVHVIAGPTGSGKTDIATNLAINQARMGAKVSIASLEMSLLQMNQRIMSILTAIPLIRINRTHDMDRATRRMLIDAYRSFHDQVRRNGGRLTVWAPDEDVSIEELLTFLRSRGYDNNIIDYMGLLKGMDGDDQWRKLGSGARYAKRFAGADKSVATLLAQLSDEGEIRYSRTIKEHASLMWQWLKPDDSGILTVKQPKARNLKSFDFPLQMDFACHRVTDVDLSQVTEKETEKQSSTSRRRRRNKEEFRI